MSESLQSHGLWHARLHRPWNFSGKNTGVGGHLLLQGIFPTQELNPPRNFLSLLHWEADYLPIVPPGKPHLNGKESESRSVVCLTLCYPMNYTVHGILQARILEWVTFSFSRGSSQPRDGTQVSCIAGRIFTS